MPSTPESYALGAISRKNATTTGPHDITREYDGSALLSSERVQKKENHGLSGCRVLAVSESIAASNLDLNFDMAPLESPRDHTSAGRSSLTSVDSTTGFSRRYQIMLLISGFLMIFNILGINFSFGVFQEYYTSNESHIRDAQGQDALVSLIGSIGSGLTWSGSIIVNPLIGRIENVRWITLSGVFIMSLGLLFASFSSRLWHLYLSQAVLYGLGASLYYFPIISLTPIYFNRHRGFAMGFILAGAGIGGLVYAPTLQFLMDTVGAMWALRIFAIWNAVTGIPIACVVKRPASGPFAFGPATRTSTRVNWELVKRGTFVYQTMGAFLQAAGNLVPMYYLTSYSVSVLSYSRSFASILLASNNAINSVSRICMGYLADKVGRQNTMIIGAFLSAISVFALWYDAARNRFIAFVIMYGIYAGGYNALLPTTITEIYGIQNYSSVNGFIYFIRGLGSMCGAPLAGLILGNYNRASTSVVNIKGLEKRYNDVVIYDGVLLMCATICVAFVRWYDAKEKGWNWKA